MNFPPACSTASIALFEAACKLTLSFLVNLPLPSNLTGNDLLIKLALNNASKSTVALALKFSSKSLRLTTWYSI